MSCPLGFSIGSTPLQDNSFYIGTICHTKPIPKPQWLSAMKIHICLHKVLCKTVRNSIPSCTGAWSTMSQTTKSKFWTRKGMGQLPGTWWQSRGRSPASMNTGTFCLLMPPLWRQHMLLYLKLFKVLVCKLLWAIDRVTNYLSLHRTWRVPRTWNFLC